MRRKTPLMVMIIFVLSSCKYFDDTVKDGSYETEYSVTKFFMDDGADWKINASYYAVNYGSGKDKKYLTSDDRLSNYDLRVTSPKNVTYLPDNDAKVILFRDFHYRGKDGKWFTDDDVVDWSSDSYNYYGYAYVESKVGGLTRYVFYELFCSVDCGPSNTIALDLDNATIFRARGVEEYYVSGNAYARLENELLLFDKFDFDGHVFEQPLMIEWSAEEGQDIYTYYLGPGPDNLLLTADDQVSRFYSLKEDLEEKIVTKSYSAGDDVTPFTQDDKLLNQELEIQIRSSNGELVEQLVEYSWADENEVLTDAGHLERQYLNGVMTHEIIYSSKGIDGEINTGDDVVSHYRVFEEESSNGDTLKVNYLKNYFSAGLDGIWFTDDDDLESVELKETRETEKEIVSLKYYLHGPGDDGVWLTSDDLKDYQGMEIREK